MFDHLSIGVTDLDRAAALYDAALAPLGIVRLWSAPRAVGYGPPGWGGEAPFDLLLGGTPRPAGDRFHLAFSASTSAAVDAFYAAAIKHGAADDGAPGIRQHYDPGYYAAFVVDPDGHRLEAVCHLKTG